MDDEELETYMRSDRGDTSVVEEEGINIIMNAENDKALTICQIINTNHYIKLSTITITQSARFG